MVIFTNSRILRPEFVKYLTIGSARAIRHLAQKRGEKLVNLCAKCRLTFPLFYDIIYTVKGHRILGEPKGLSQCLEKNFSKNFEKPLDKYQKIWYNIYVRKRGK